MTIKIGNIQVTLFKLEKIARHETLRIVIDDNKRSLEFAQIAESLDLAGLAARAKQLRSERN